MTVLSVRNLGLRYKNKVLMKDLSLDLFNGEAVGVLGCNGAGKTTLFDLITGVKQPTEGEITNSSVHQAYLTQVLTPPPLLRMSEACQLVTHLNASDPPDQEEMFSRITKWSPSLFKRYSEIWQKKAATCSYGEIRSFFTLTLLLMKSDLIILDEPTAGVDPEFRHYIWLGIRSACEEGASVLVSSHYTEEIVANCKRFYMLANQQLEAFDSGAQFMARHGAMSLDEAFINASL
jgi:ABC-2 type transport system ATP-binding protein